MTRNQEDSFALIDKLNDDCLERIFQFFPYKNRIAVERVCKRWQIVSQRSWIDINYIWQAFMVEKNITDEKIFQVLQRGVVYLKKVCMCYSKEDVNPLRSDLEMRSRIFNLLKEKAVNLRTIFWTFQVRHDDVVEFLLKRVGQFNEMIVCPVYPPMRDETLRKIFNKATKLKVLTWNWNCWFSLEGQMNEFAGMLPSTLEQIKFM
ncbi:uncharacterized protein LOC106652556 [Trichogramma pretiosum]|uniref:uncharacterized protein LOC106652556 n=1 Tax=Trichogramma pretiosum TaxID=7493 RepID=UPI0006C9C08A|nr:uncharacterized protein LOC106652556 [Trichogramma pretiosum]